MKRVALLAVFGMMLAGRDEAGHSIAASKPIQWPAPKDPLTLTRRAGLVPELFEHLTYHVHAHLDVFVNGQSVTVPAGIGINIHDPGVHRSSNPTFYGGISMCLKPCISPLHTHTTDGVLHTETSTPKPHYLGQFFIEWGVRLTSSCVNTYCRPKTKVAIYIDGKLYRGNPNSILLSDHREIAVVVGSPPRHIPSSYAW